LCEQLLPSHFLVRVYGAGVNDETASGDGLEFIESATGKTVQAARVDDGWLVESDDGTETHVTLAEFEANYTIRAGGDS